MAFRSVFDRVYAIVRTILTRTTNLARRHHIARLRYNSQVLHSCVRNCIWNVHMKLS